MESMAISKHALINRMYIKYDICVWSHLSKMGQLWIVHFELLVYYTDHPVVLALPPSHDVPSTSTMDFSANVLK